MAFYLMVSFLPHGELPLELAIGGPYDVDTSIAEAGLYSLARLQSEGSDSQTIEGEDAYIDLMLQRRLDSDSQTAGPDRDSTSIIAVAAALLLKVFLRLLTFVIREDDAAGSS